MVEKKIVFFFSSGILENSICTCTCAYTHIKPECVVSEGMNEILNINGKKERLEKSLSRLRAFKKKFKFGLLINKFYTLHFTEPQEPLPLAGEFMLNRPKNK